jgi:hypothetical protein
MSEEIRKLLFPLSTQEEIDKHWKEFLESRGQ